jgi:hypothetical protein
MKSILIIIAIVFTASFTACNSTVKDQAKTNKVVKKQYKYICIMHPGTGADKPGICAKCGMQLVERDTDK